MSTNIQRCALRVMSDSNFRTIPLTTTTICYKSCVSSQFLLVESINGKSPSNQRKRRKIPQNRVAFDEHQQLPMNKSIFQAGRAAVVNNLLAYNHEYTIPANVRQHLAQHPKTQIHTNRSLNNIALYRLLIVDLQQFKTLFEA